MCGMSDSSVIMFSGGFLWPRVFIATTNEASQRTQDYMKEGLEQGSSSKERVREG